MNFATILLSCLLLASQCSAREDSNQQIEEIVNMMAVKMVEVQENVAELRMEMEEKGKKMEEMQKEMAAKDKKMEEITKELKDVMDVGQKSLRDLPYVMTCAFNGWWSTPSATITYDRLIADFNNSDRPGGGDGSMDINTGVYTAPSRMTGLPASPGKFQIPAEIVWENGRYSTEPPSTAPLCRGSYPTARP